VLAMPSCDAYACHCNRDAEDDRTMVKFNEKLAVRNEELEELVKKLKKELSKKIRKEVVTEVKKEINILNNKQKLKNI